MAIGASTNSRSGRSATPEVGAFGKSTSTDDRNLKFEQLYQARQHSAKHRETPEQEALTTWKKAVAGDAQARSELLHQMEPTINAALANLVGGDERYKTRARLIVVDAINGFDPNQGTSLNTYMYNRLKGLSRISADRGNFIHVPEKSASERRQLEAIKQDYMLETGTEPSLAMLADKSGMPINKVSRLMSIFGTTSTSTTRGEHGDSLEAQKRTANELYIDSFYNELPEIDKKIYEWSTGYKGSPQLDRPTMAKRLGMSEAAVSQHAHKIDRMAARFDQTLTGSLYA